jgi:hypothetical protein
LARLPRNPSAATSYARAAASAVSKVPSHTRAALCGSRISAAHFPHGRCRTPRYRLRGALPLLLPALVSAEDGEGIWSLEPDDAAGDCCGGVAAATAAAPYSAHTRQHEPS